MSNAEIIGEFKVSVHEADVTAIHRKYGHEFRFLRSPNSPYIGTPSWRENELADRAPDGFVSDATKAVLVKLRRKKLIP